MTWSYQLEYGRTSAQPAFFCAVFNVCEEAARAQLTRLSRTAVAGWAVSRNRADNVVSPTRGSVMRLDLRHASTLIGSSANIAFNRATLDAATYFPAFGGAMVLRFRGGAVVGSRLSFDGSNTFIPLQERLYAGGPNTVRGYRQNELGPAIYLPRDFVTLNLPGDDTLAYLRANPAVTTERVVPTGGDNLVVANAELRLRSVIFPELVQYALFVDAGQVWNRGRSGTGVNFSDVRITPGGGVRIFSPIGPVRVDIGYNPHNRPSGPAYFVPTPTQLANSEYAGLICVSPGNTLRVVIGNENRPTQQIDQGPCPATYTPSIHRSFFSRLTFNFSIGQPF
jgi:outer membrane protein insertion porin family/translocation and assembly module TamA